MKLRTFFLFALVMITALSITVPASKWFALAGWLSASIMSVLYDLSEHRREQLERSRRSFAETFLHERTPTTRTGTQQVGRAVPSAPSPAFDPERDHPAIAASRSHPISRS